MKKKAKAIVARSAGDLAEVLGLERADGIEIAVRSALNTKVIQVIEKRGLTHAQVAALAGTSRTRIDPPTLEQRWNLILRHCELHVREWGAEEPAIRSMRARLMAYSKSMPEAKRLREKFSQVSTLSDVRAIAEENILNLETRNPARIQTPAALAF